VSHKESEVKQADLLEQIGRLKMELEWLKEVTVQGVKPPRSKRYRLMPWSSFRGPVQAAKELSFKSVDNAAGNGSALVAAMI